MKKVTERFAYSSFKAGPEEAPSRLIRGATIYVEPNMRCPRCGTERGPLTHGVPIWCEECGLEMERLGNCLQITGTPED